ncbi:MAG: hypothetical protein WC788_04440 [Candidatus Paceibacterota bacterium]|jgi:hypothetical protein
MITDDQIAKYQFLWKQRFNEEISKEEALKEGLKLITLITAICCPEDEAEFQRLKQLSEKIKSQMLNKT